MKSFLCCVLIWRKETKRSKEEEEEGDGRKYLTHGVFTITECRWTPSFKKKDRSMHQEKLHTLLANLTEKRYDSNAASNGTI